MNKITLITIGNLHGFKTGFLTQTLVNAGWSADQSTRSGGITSATMHRYVQFHLLNLKYGFTKAFAA
jgi:hypothetical protein